MQYVIVEYPRTRDVFVDGRRLGTTGQVLSVPEGVMEFTLGKPVDYRPNRRRVVVAGTSPISPLRVTFG